MISFAICGESCSNDVSDLANVVTHEAGHFLGLGHSEIPGTTMSTTAFLGDTDKRTLEADDRAGVCAVYGERTEPSCESEDFAPDNGFASRCVVDLPPCADAGAGEDCEDEDPSGSEASSDGPNSGTGGCGCAVPGAAERSGTATLLASALLALLVVTRRRRTRRS
jgi:MYXO-CTERM domain-containing protein